MTIECDVAEPDQVSVAIEAIVKRFGRIDSLVNNAGVPILYRSLKQIMLTDRYWVERLKDEFRQVIDRTQTIFNHGQFFGGKIHKNTVVRAT